MTMVLFLMASIYFFCPSVLALTGFPFAVMQTHKDGAVLKLEQSDFVFPEPVKSGAKRPAIWDCVVSENQSQCCNFTYD